MLSRLFYSEYLVLLLCVVYFAALAPLAPGFATPENLINIAAAMLPLLVVATGQTLVLITAGIDLSATSIIAVSSVAGAALMTGDDGLLAGHPLAIPISIAAMLLVGASIGLFNGTCIAALKMPPFIVTLTSMMFFSGLAIWLTQSKSIYNLPDGFLFLGQNVWTTATIALSVAVIAQLLLSRTLFGRGLRAIGGNVRTAQVSGIAVARLTILVYVLSGICAAIAAVLITGRLETGSPVHWRNNLLDVIGATVIGGTSLYGGKGKVIWTLFGVLLLTLIDNSLDLLALSYFSIMMVKGGVILLAAILDSLRHRAAAQ
jgi:ribose/xylose/arabinose/galactoside ABC-type transport system permease subunit